MWPKFGAGFRVCFGLTGSNQVQLEFKIIDKIFYLTLKIFFAINI